MPGPNQLGIAVRPVALNTLKLKINCSETHMQQSSKHRAMPGPNQLGIAVGLRPAASNTLKLYSKYISSQFC